MAAPSENSRKIFLGNLHPHTNDDYKNRLKEFFGHFGEVEDVHIIIDKETGESRGFAFLTFADVLIVERVLGEYMFDGQTIQARRATRRARPAEKHKGKGRGSNFTSGEGEDENTDANHTGQNPGSSSSGLVAGKIFVGGLHHSLNEKTLREYFERFGEIANAIILYDQTTKNSRGFGFVTFREESSADKLLNHPGSHELGGKVVEVKRATPRKDTPRRQFSNSGSLWEKGSLHSHPYGDRRSDANEPYYIHADMHPGGPSVGYVQHQQYAHQQASPPHYHNQPQGFVPMQFQQPPYFPHGYVATSLHPHQYQMALPSQGPVIMHPGQASVFQNQYVSSVFVPPYGHPGTPSTSSDQTHMMPSRVDTVAGLEPPSMPSEGRGGDTTGPSSTPLSYMKDMAEALPK